VGRYIIDEVAHVGVVEQVVQEAGSIVLLEVLVVSEGPDAQRVGQSPESLMDYHLASTSLVSFSSSSLLGVGSKK
jgi:hypothetical protein